MHKEVIDLEDKNKEVKLSVNFDATPILYTDNIFVNVNEDGVMIDFCQHLGNTNQVRVVSRIGMSKSHAKKFLKAFEDTIKMSEGQLQTGKVAQA